MRRVLTIAALLLCLGAVGCDPNDPGVKVANSAADAAQSSPLPWLNLVGTLGAAALGAFGLRKAGTATRYTESGWSRDDLSELIDALEKAPDQALRLDKALEKARKGAS